MKILHKMTYKRDLPFTMKVKGRVIHKKVATLYFIETDQGILTTELAPFPGLSDKNLQSCEFQFEKSLDQKTHHNHHVAFSLFELHFKRKWKGELNTDDILLNGLCHHTNLTQSNHSTLKIKIDHNINLVMSNLEKNEKWLKTYKLRLDGNQQLETHQVKTVLKRCKELNLDVEYFEEPLKNPREYKEADYPFALDESLHLRSYFTKTNVLIFKPTQFFTQKLWEERNSYSLILSSTFDSIFTHTTLLAMAQSLQHKKAHGLDHGHAYDFLGKLSYLKASDIFPVLSKNKYQEIISKL